MGILKNLFDIGNGIRSGISDVPSLVGNILEFDVHGVATDGRKIIGDVDDVLKGMAGLGVELGSAPIKYMGKLAPLADSPVLAAAQLAIEGEKKLTGSGSLEQGSEYWASSIALEKALEVLIGADLDREGWDGLAAEKYAETSLAHRKHVSNVSVADSDLGRILKKEADQVRRTREVLDSTSQALYDYGLATRAALAIPGANAAKLLFADTAAAAAALATTNAQMTLMLSDSIQNASEIRQASDHYEAAKHDTSGNAGGCGPFIDPKQDQNNLPSRANPKMPYEQRQLPPVYGPPATPLPVESEVPPTYDLPADLPRPHITPPSHLPGGVPE